MLTDIQIIALFNERSEEAIKSVSEKYGKLCLGVSQNILKNVSDAEECVNDTYLALWQKIPPENPSPLKAYVLRIVRNISVTKYHTNTSAKRNSYYDTALDELEDCFAVLDDAESEFSASQLSALINRFLGKLNQKNTAMFVRRYWYSDSISDMAKMFKCSENSVSARLSRIRKDLKEFLRKEGYDV